MPVRARNSWAARLAACAALLLVAGCAGAAYEARAPLHDVATQGAASVVVQGNAGEWRDTGVIVTTGQRYRVQAEGRWRAFPGCAFTGPTGEGMYGPLCIPWNVGKILTNNPHQALLARIGENGEPFAVNGAHEFTADRDGMLLLHMNEEASGVWDNEGSMNATVALAGPGALAQPVAPKAAPAPAKVAAAAPQPAPPPRLETPKIGVPRFPRGAERPDDVAVIIGNGEYGRQGRDIPDVRPAHADAAWARAYAVQALGIREGNVIFLEDATGAQMVRVFGSDKDHRGQLFDWVKSGKSRVFVYYSGHGAPGGQGGMPMLIPSDADAARIELNGYPLQQLYDNLGKLPAERVTVVLEACFSGLSPAGSVLGKASPVFFEVKAPPVPGSLTVIAAGAANQMASWEPDESHGLFTRHFFEGMAGKADANRDGAVGLDELDRYLKETLTYWARRHYGRDQQAQIVRGGGR